MCSSEQLNLEHPVGFSIHERNQRLMGKLIQDGYVVTPVLQPSEDLNVRHISYLKVSCSIDLVMNHSSS